MNHKFKKYWRDLQLKLSKVFHDPDLDWVLVWIVTTIISLLVVTLSIIDDTDLLSQTDIVATSSASIRLDIDSLNKTLEEYRVKADIFADIQASGLSVPEPKK